ncbi:MAG: DUF1844 domain-containing protein [Desulfobacteraceae bacterium]|nr:MAG: DUF1844 domain-containing protein [Desulfobacteraceae bacterium]
MPEEKKDFIIKDRRIFSQENPDKEKVEKENTQETTKKEPKEEVPTAGKSDAKEAEACLPEINFPTFIMSLNASALVNLGILDNPANGKKEINLSMAKQTIDILCLLEEKTQGNLSKDEESMLKNILYDLRIIYVKEKK